MGRVYVSVGGHRLTCDGHPLYIGDLNGKAAVLRQPLDFRSRRLAACSAMLSARSRTVSALIQEISAASKASSAFVQPLLTRRFATATLAQPLNTAQRLIRQVALAQDLSAFAPCGYDIVSMNLDTGEELVLGFAREDGLALTGVSIADGFYLIRTRPRGLFWDGYRSERSWLIVVVGGELATPLPLAQTAAYQYRLNDTLLWWQWLPIHVTYDPTDWAIWVSEAEPVDVGGDPDYTVLAHGTGRYSVAISQGQTAIYVAVRARRGTDLGPITTLAIPEPPAQLPSPVNQLAWV
jgi:hypothetical protein